MIMHKILIRVKVCTFIIYNGLGLDKNAFNIKIMLKWS